MPKITPARTRLSAGGKCLLFHVKARVKSIEVLRVEPVGHKAENIVVGQAGFLLWYDHIKRT